MAAGLAPLDIERQNQRGRKHNESNKISGHRLILAVPKIPLWFKKRTSTCHALAVVGMTIVDNSDEADDQTPRMVPNGLRNGTGQKTKKRLLAEYKADPDEYSGV